MVLALSPHDCTKIVASVKELPQILRKEVLAICAMIFMADIVSGIVSPSDVKENRGVYRRCSPIYHVANATTSTFLVHGEGRYPRSDASLKFARALEREYKIYPNECYYVRSEANLRRRHGGVAPLRSEAGRACQAGGGALRLHHPRT